MKRLIIRGQKSKVAKNQRLLSQEYNMAGFKYGIYTNQKTRL